ncbi:MAG: hypothetical protein GXO77_08550, partial [Calditrichaeota bacterium]|nr:hypothetical protein [Calditrichota bacterium]
PNVLLSALKKAEDDSAVVFRFYEIEGKDADINLDFFRPIKKIIRTNLIEEEGDKTESKRLKITPYSVETIKAVIE